MEVFEKSDIGGVLDFLRLSHQHWQFAQTVSPTHTWLFRGQGDSGWPLTPKSLRSIPEADTDQSLPLPWRAAANEFGRLGNFLD